MVWRYLKLIWIRKSSLSKTPCIIYDWIHLYTIMPDYTHFTCITTKIKEGPLYFLHKVCVTFPMLLPSNHTPSLQTRNTNGSLQDRACRSSLEKNLGRIFYFKKFWFSSTWSSCCLGSSKLRRFWGLTTTRSQFCLYIFWRESGSAALVRI